MSDKQHCRCCGAELVECDECHGYGQVQMDGPMDTETGQIGYLENCGECGGRGGYPAPAVPVERLKARVAEIRETASKARDRGHDGTAASFEFAADALDKVIEECTK